MIMNRGLIPSGGGRAIRRPTLIFISSSFKTVTSIAGLRFELRFSASEALVLPLDDPAFFSVRF